MPHITDYEHGISAIDSGFGRPQLAAIHLIAEGDRAALVDTGTNASLPIVLDALKARGLSPAQFEPAAMHASIDRLLALRPEAIYVTHYGQVRDVPRLGDDLHRLIDAHVEAALRHRNAGAERHGRIKAGLAEILVGEAQRQGWRMALDGLFRLMAVDIERNAQGLGAWLDSGA